MVSNTLHNNKARLSVQRPRLSKLLATLTALAATVLSQSGAADNSNTNQPPGAVVSYQITLQPAAGNEPIQTLVLTENLQAKLSYANGEDIHIIDSQGNAVPYLIKQSKRLHQSENSQPLLFYPVNLPEQKQGQGQNQIVQPGQNGSAVHITINTQAKAKQASAQIHRYIIETAKLKSTSLDELVLQWNDDFEGIAPLRLETSNELGKWQLLIRKVAVSHLQHQDKELKNNRVKIDQPVKKYLRLSWLQDSHPTLSAINAVTRVSSSQYVKSWSDDLTLDVSSEEHALLFTRPAAFHSSQLRFVEAANAPKNSAYLGRIYSRSHNHANWQKRSDFRFFSIKNQKNGKTKLQAELNNSHHEYWKIEFDQPQTNPDKNISIQLQKRQLALYFFNQGNSPYTLKFGSSKKADSDLNQLMQDILSSAEKHYGQASTGQIEVIKHAAPTPERNWKKWILWLVLGLAVLLMFTMARSLTQQMRKAKT